MMAALGGPTSPTASAPAAPPPDVWPPGGPPAPPAGAPAARRKARGSRHRQPVPPRRRRRARGSRRRRAGRRRRRRAPAARRGRPGAAAGAPAAPPPPNLWPPTPPVPPAPNPRVQGILLGLMRERGDIYAGFTDVELRGLLQAHSGDVAACHETVLRLQAAGAARGVSSSELFRQTAPPPQQPGTVLQGPYQPGGPPPQQPAEPQRPKKKRHRPSRDKARDRVLRRVPLTLQDVDALDWNEACEYAKAMGVSKKSHTTRDAYRDACKTWFVGRETDVFVPAKAPAAPRQRWQRALPDSGPRRRPAPAPAPGPPPAQRRRRRPLAPTRSRRRRARTTTTRAPVAADGARRARDRRRRAHGARRAAAALGRQQTAPTFLSGRCARIGRTSGREHRTCNQAS